MGGFGRRFAAAAAALWMLAAAAPALGAETPVERVQVFRDTLAPDYLSADRVRKIPEGGFAVVEVAEGGLYREAGFRPGDVLLSMCGVPLDTLDAYVLVREAAESGGRLIFLVKRGDARHYRVVTIEDGAPTPGPLAPYPSLCHLLAQTGLGPSEYTDLDGRRVPGLAVSALEPGTLLSILGVRENDVLVSLYGTALERISDAPLLLEALSEPGHVEMVVWRRGPKYRLGFDLVEKDGALTFENRTFAPVE